MICSIVVLYEPKSGELNSILNYCDLVDYSFVLDNSKESHENEVNSVLRGRDTLRYRYVHFGENIGLCKVLNYGMNLARKENYDWALLMDSDSIVVNDIVFYYKKILQSDKKNNNIAVLAPVHIFDRSKKVVYEGNKQVKWAMTSGSLYNVSIFEKLHGFKEELFVDGLDMDYCYKARENGYKIIEVGAAEVKHFPAETRTLSIGHKEVFKYGYASFNILKRVLET